MNIKKSIKYEQYINNDKDVTKASYEFIEYKDLRKVQINSLCIALFLSIQLFKYFLNINTLVSSVIILIISILNNRTTRLNKKALLFYSFILFWFGITRVFFDFGKESFIYLIFFIIYGGVALYLSNKEYVARKVLLYLCIIHSLVAPFVLVSAIIDGSTMGEVYSLIGGVFALITFVFPTRFKLNPGVRLLFLNTLIIYIYKISLVSTRGAYLSILVFLILYYIISKINTSWKTNMILVLLLIFAYFSYIYLYEIMSIMEGLLRKMDITINVISKSVRLLEADRFDHNRNWFYSYALDGIKKNWVFGQGIGAFEKQTGRVYIHNVILQLLFEGGIVYFLPFALALLKIPKWILPVNDRQKEEQIFIMILISSSLVKLMFSETYLKEQKFLLLLMILLIRKKE